MAGLVKMGILNLEGIGFPIIQGFPSLQNRQFTPWLPCCSLFQEALNMQTSNSVNVEDSCREFKRYFLMKSLKNSDKVFNLRVVGLRTT
jgi:hypothetical protein